MALDQTASSHSFLMADRATENRQLAVRWPGTWKFVMKLWLIVGLNLNFMSQFCFEHVCQTLHEGFIC